MTLTRLKNLSALAVLTLALASCSRSPESRTAAAGVPVPREVIDLSPTITEDLPVRMWGHKPLSDFGFSDSTQFKHIEGDKPLYVANSYLTLFNHAGPHVDSPNHLARGAKGIDAFPLETFVGRLQVFDFRDRPEDQPLARTEFEGKGIAAGDIVIAFVGYRAPTEPDRIPSYAYLSPDAAEYLATIPVKLFGTDALSVESFRRLYELGPDVTGYEDVAPVHHAFLSRDIPVMEQLVNVEQIVGRKDAIFVGLPLKIANGNGSPIRAAAFIY